MFVSASGGRSIWLRHDLENFKKRLKALEKKVADDGIILTDAQIAALEKKRQEDEVCGEIDTAHLGYLGSQDTFYVGNLKALVEFTSRHLSTHTAKWLLLSFIRLKHPPLRLTYSTIKSCHILNNMSFLCYVYSRI